MIEPQLKTVQDHIQEDFLGELMFQSHKVPRTLISTGTIWADVDPVTGGFATWQGDDKIPLKVPIYNARNLTKTLDDNGFQLCDIKYLPEIDFCNEEAIIRDYYTAVAKMVKEYLNAYQVYTFDHAVRNTGVSSKYTVKEGQKVGGPALVVHGDYSMDGAPIRRDRLALPPSKEDSFQQYYKEKPLIASEEMETLKDRRFAIINLWRSFTLEPCVDHPLTFCDTQTVEKGDYATVEFRYSDKTIDTYLGGYHPRQKWFYFPELRKDEGILIKTYDSQGALFEDFLDYPYRLSGEPLVPATAVLHSAVEDPRLKGKDYRSRESIEVRSIVFY